MVFAGYCGSRTSILARHSKAFTQAQGNVGSVVADTVSNASSVRLFNGHSEEHKRLQLSTNTMQAARQRQLRYMIRYALNQTLIFETFMVLVFGALLYLSSQHRLSPGLFVFVLLQSLLVVESLWEGVITARAFSDGYGTIQATLDTVYSGQPDDHSPSTKRLHVADGTIEFNQIDFGYHDSKILKGLSLAIQRKTKIGIVGASGAGKSTLINLLLGQIHPASGSITIDGQRLDACDLTSIRQHIAVVPQHTELFQRSVMENIRYGKPSTSDEEVIDAAKKAHAHDFILQMNNGYATQLAERGTTLSGGQRQRIAIARAFLRNAPILVLDEATAQLDTTTEAHIQTALDELSEGRTTIVIAHRLATIQHMDRIIVMSNGRVVEYGSHHELINANGRTKLYQKLWQSQQDRRRAEDETVS